MIASFCLGARSSHCVFWSVYLAAHLVACLSRSPRCRCSPRCSPHCLLISLPAHHATSPPPRPPLPASHASGIWVNVLWSLTFLRSGLPHLCVGGLYAREFCLCLLSCDSVRVYDRVCDTCGLACERVGVLYVSCCWRGRVRQFHGRPRAGQVLVVRSWCGGQDSWVTSWWSGLMGQVSWVVVRSHGYTLMGDLLYTLILS